MISSDRMKDCFGNSAQKYRLPILQLFGRCGNNVCSCQDIQETLHSFGAQHPNVTQLSKQSQATSNDLEDSREFGNRIRFTPSALRPSLERTGASVRHSESHRQHRTERPKGDMSCPLPL